MRSWVWVSAALAPLFLIGGWTLAQLRQPASYDPVRDTISALARHGATDRWIMTAALVGLGVCHLLTAAGFAALGRTARLVLAAGGAGSILVAVFALPSPAHGPAATLAFVALAVWPACAAGELRRPGRVITVVLLALIAWFEVAMAAGVGVGVSERVLAGAESLVPLAAALQLRSPALVPARPEREPADLRE